MTSTAPPKNDDWLSREWEKHLLRLAEEALDYADGDLQAALQYMKRMRTGHEDICLGDTCEDEELMAALRFMQEKM